MMDVGMYCHLVRQSWNTSAGCFILTLWNIGHVSLLNVWPAHSLFSCESFYVFSFVLIFFIPLFISKRLDGYKREGETTFKKHTRNSFRMTRKAFLFIFLIQELIRCIFQVRYASKLKNWFFLLLIFWVLHYVLEVLCGRIG